MSSDQIIKVITNHKMKVTVEQRTITKFSKKVVKLWSKGSQHSLVPSVSHLINIVYPKMSLHVS